MTLTDPTGGSGYAFGAVLPSTHMTSVTSQLPYAIDGNAGGSYAPSGNINIADSGGGGLGNVECVGNFEMVVGAFFGLRPGTAIADSDNQTLNPNGGLVREFVVPTATRNHDIVAAGNAGRCFIVRRPWSGAYGIIIHRSGFSGAAIVTLNASIWASALLYDDGSNWRLGLASGYSASATADTCIPGADA